MTSCTGPLSTSSGSSSNITPYRAALAPDEQTDREEDAGSGNADTAATVGAEE